jgi:GrpB-like predicted nucleotidyltransferase (UPF0157 family)
MRKVEVHPYNEQWKPQFDLEAAKLKGVFGNTLIDIHHIGSTAVPGLSAKPIIDLMPIVRDIQTIDALQYSMEELGYEALGENGLPGRRYFQKGGNARTHHVHVYEKENPEITEVTEKVLYLTIKPVRKSVSFGLLQAISSLACPKKRLIRILTSNLEPNLSEKASHSDSHKLFRA